MTFDLDSELIDVIKSKNWTRENVGSLADFKTSNDYRCLRYGVSGRSSVADMGRRHKFIDERFWQFTPYELGRSYLQRIMDSARHQRKSLGYSRRTIRYLEHYPPQFFSGSHDGPLAYIDMVSAYWQLYTPLTLDMKYCLEHSFLGRGTIDFLHPHEIRRSKKMRNGLIGIVKSNIITHVYNGKEVRVKKHGKFCAPDLWGYLVHTLHAVAVDAIEKFGESIRYVNIDGFVVDLKIKDSFQDYLFSEWRIQSSVKGESGDGNISGFGSYKIGKACSKKLWKGDPVFSGLMDLSEKNIADLKRWRMWAVNFGMEA